MKTIKLLLVINLVIFCACNKSKTTNDLVSSDGAESLIVNDTIPTATLPSKDENKIKKIIFEKYENDEGFIINKKIPTYNDSLRFKEYLNLKNDITIVPIIERTNEMKSVSGDMKDICSLAYFLKMKYNDSEYIIDGFSINQLDTLENSSITITENSEKTELLSITNFAMGASNEDGLTGCDDYSPLLVKSNEEYYLIEGKKDSYYTEKNNINYFFLEHDEGISEEMMSASLNNDTIVVSIHRTYQEGWNDCDLNIFKKNNKYRFYIDNETERSFD